MFGEKILLRFASLLLFCIKSINYIQNYSHIIESFARILYLSQLLISLGICLAPKLSRYIARSFLT